MAADEERDRPLTYGEARTEWLAKHERFDSVGAIVGCLNHSTFSWWQDPRTGRSVAVVESVSQWPRVEQVIGTTQLVRKTGPFDSLSVFNDAALRFRLEVERRYGPLT